MDTRRNIQIMQALCLSTALAVGTICAQPQVEPHQITPSSVGSPLTRQSGPDYEWARANGDVNLIYGTDGDDAICAPNEDCSWASARGMNVIRSTNGDDFICFICPGHGNDYVNAGDGDDEIWVDPYRSRSDKPGIVGEHGFKRLFGGNGDDMITDARNSAYIVGGCGRDVLSGGNSNDTIYGHLAPGDTTPCPNANDWDSLEGGAGSDSVACLQQLAMADDIGARSR